METRSWGVVWEKSRNLPKLSKIESISPMRSWSLAKPASLIHTCCGTKLLFIWKGPANGRQKACSGCWAKFFERTGFRKNVVVFSVSSRCSSKWTPGFLGVGRNNFRLLPIYQFTWECLYQNPYRLSHVFSLLEVTFGFGVVCEKFCQLLGKIGWLFQFNYGFWVHLDHHQNNGIQNRTPCSGEKIILFENQLRVRFLFLWCG